VSTNHDSEYSCGFYIEEDGNGHSFTYFTDTGSTTPLMKMYAEKCSSLFIESDYDDVQLELYPEYPDYLKERIRSDFGHLSNTQMANFIKSLKNSKDLKNIFVGHLSPRTNTPDLVKKTIQEIIPEYADKIVFAPFETFYDI
jgi:ribonuclease BN (tRNA processing enzyme)